MTIVDKMRAISLVWYLVHILSLFMWEAARDSVGLVDLVTRPFAVSRDQGVQGLSKYPVDILAHGLVS